MFWDFNHFVQSMLCTSNIIVCMYFFILLLFICYRVILFLEQSIASFVELYKNPFLSLRTRSTFLLFYCEYVVSCTFGFYKPLCDFSRVLSSASLSVVMNVSSISITKYRSVIPLKIVHSFCTLFFVRTLLKLFANSDSLIIVLGPTEEKLFILG